MITLPRGKDTKLWNKFWSETKKEWFKVEMLQDYSGEDSGPSLQAWLKGDKEKSIRLMREKTDSNEWIKMAGGKSFKKIRIHIVENPILLIYNGKLKFTNISISPLPKKKFIFLIKRKLQT